MANERTTRRRYLGTLGAAVAGGVAGCSAVGDGDDSPTSARANAQEEATGTATPDGATAEPSAPDDPSVYRQVYEESIDSVVLIRRGDDAGGGQGSGFVFRDGNLVTNAHVVGDASDVQVRFARGEWYDASVAGTDPSTDLAVVRVDDPPGYAGALPLVEDEPTVGTEVVAIGSPYGLVGSLTSGLISGVNRSIPAPNGYTIPDAVQTSAPVNPGNSGGPLADLDGRVEGVVSSGGGDNLAFAVSAALVRRVVPSLVESGDYDHPYLGVRLSTLTPAAARRAGLEDPSGVLVVGVSEDGPSAGTLRPGDVLLSIDGRRVEDQGALASYLALEASPGDTVSVTVVRDGERRELELTLGERPERPRAGR